MDVLRCNQRVRELTKNNKRGVKIMEKKIDTTTKEYAFKAVTGFSFDIAGDITNEDDIKRCADIMRRSDNGLTQEEIDEFEIKAIECVKK